MASIQRGLTSGNKLLSLFKTSCRLYSNKIASSSAPQLLTFQDILTDENKVRSQTKLKSVDPVRSVENFPLKAGHNCAAVLVPLCTVNQEPSFLFTLRSTRLRHNRGQVSFPGGNCDDTDSDVVYTALRETEEELGMDTSKFDIWGQMKPLPAADGTKFVYPILAKVGEVDVSKLKVNHDEVEEAFTVPLHHLCHHANTGSTHFRSGGGYTIPVYTGAAHRIWGLTAIIVHQALNIIAPGLYTFKLRQRKPILPGNHGNHNKRGGHHSVGQAV